MGKKTGSKKRYRLTVPEEDTSVIAWMEAQDNASASLRQLIREDIIKNGCTDVTCREVEQGPKRGRPTNAERFAREAAAAGYADTQPHEKPAPKPAPVPVRQQPAQEQRPQTAEQPFVSAESGEDYEDMLASIMS